MFPFDDVTMKTRVVFAFEAQYQPLYNPKENIDVWCV